MSPRGFTLVELLIFIVVIAAAIAGVLKVFTEATTRSADPAVFTGASAAVCGRMGAMNLAIFA